MRLERHNEGRAAAFTKRRPVELVYREPYGTREEALARERQIRRWTRRKKDALIAGDSTLLMRL
jgi:tRNA/rRNA methyltransferase